MEKKEFTYEIGGKRCIQRALTLGQIAQLSQLFKGMSLPQKPKIEDIVCALGEKLPRFIAIVLVEEGKPLKDKDLDIFTREIEHELSYETACQVIEDFFSCNNIPGMLRRFTSMTDRIFAHIQQDTQKTSTPNAQSSSQEGTSQRGIQSSGTIASPNA